MTEKHPGYGGCDGFGPLWTCSECVGVIGCNDASFVDACSGDDIDADEAASRVGDYLLERIKMVAVAAYGCCETPAQIESFMERSLWFDLPGNPWRNKALAESIVKAPK